MKAIIRNSKGYKEITIEYIGKTVKTKFYKDISTNKIYSEESIELKEYYGG